MTRENLKAANFLNQQFVLFMAFLDFEMVYDTIGGHGTWHMLRAYGVGGKLLKAVPIFYVDSLGCGMLRVTILL